MLAENKTENTTCKIIKPKCWLNLKTEKQKNKFPKAKSIIQPNAQQRFGAIGV